VKGVSNMGKIMGIGSINENTRVFYEESLKNILGDKHLIKSYNFREYNGDLIDVDILLISTPIMINMIKKFIKKIIVIRRTFNKKAFDQLNEIPKNIKAFVVNNGIDSTFETISSIYSLGFEFKLFPQISWYRTIRGYRCCYYYR
jgi:hypothetical protein